MTIPKILAWVGTALQVAGAAGLATRWVAPPDAYLVMLAGSAIWLDLAARRRDWPLAAMQAVFVTLNLIGVWQWWT